MEMRVDEKTEQWSHIHKDLETCARLYVQLVGDDCQRTVLSRENRKDPELRILI